MPSISHPFLQLCKGFRQQHHPSCARNLITGEKVWRLGPKFRGLDFRQLSYNKMPSAREINRSGAHKSKGASNVQPATDHTPVLPRLQKCPHYSCWDVVAAINPNMIPQHVMWRNKFLQSWKTAGLADSVLHWSLDFDNMENKNMWFPPAMAKSTAWRPFALPAQTTVIGQLRECNLAH